MTVIVDSVNEFPPEFGKNYYHINVNEVQIHSFHFKKKKKYIFFYILIYFGDCIFEGCKFSFRDGIKSQNIGIRKRN